MSDALKRRQRCAVYTRKSSEEGLEQEYNSIDAQRDAGHAYIASQRAEGWIPVSDDYDDGGFSGGSMDRPALKRLMQDIEARFNRHRRRVQDRSTHPQSGRLLENG
jgi:site-specific DNA recombinase